MKTKLALFAALMLSLQSWAGSLPTPLEKSMRPLDIRSASLSGRVLTIVSNRIDINLEQFEFALTNGVCAPLLMDGRRGWGGQDIERVEFRSSAGSETYKIGNARQACKDIGGIAGGSEPVRRYLKQKAQVCQGDRCGAIAN